MQLVRIDADDGTVFSMQRPDVKGVLTTKDYVVIEFVPLILSQRRAILSKFLR